MPKVYIQVEIMVFSSASQLSEAAPRAPSSSVGRALALRFPLSDAKKEKRGAGS